MLFSRVTMWPALWWLCLSKWTVYFCIHGSCSKWQKWPKTRTSTPLTNFSMSQRTSAFVWGRSSTWRGIYWLTTLGWIMLGISWHLWCSWTSWSLFISTVYCEQISSQSAANQTASANLPRTKMPEGNIQNTEHQSQVTKRTSAFHTGV